MAEAAERELSTSGHTGDNGSDEPARDEDEIPSEMERIVRRIRAWKCSGWDPITVEAVTAGAFVLADTEIDADNDQECILECARGVVCRAMKSCGAKSGL